MMKQLVEAPRIFPAKHNLVDSANKVDTGDGTWENGVEFAPLGCYRTGGVQANCPPPDKGDFLQCIPTAKFMPYVITAPFIWSAMDRYTDVKALATKTLEAGTSAELEDLVWNGVNADVNPLLANALPITGGTPLQALGQIETKLLDTGEHTGGGGTIYMSPVVGCQVWGVLHEEGDRLVTETCGNTVIIGNFPTDAIAAHIGAVDVYLGDIFITGVEGGRSPLQGLRAAAQPPAADLRAFQPLPDVSGHELAGPRTNEQLVMAERLAMAVFNPCAAFIAPVT